MTTVYVAAFEPSPHSENPIGGVGGFEWRLDPDKARDEFNRIVQDIRGGDDAEWYGAVLVELEVQAHLTDEITDEIDAQVDDLFSPDQKRLASHFGAQYQEQK